MALPRGTQVGDTIKLTYLGNTPRLTFVMDQPAINAVQPVRLSQTAQQLTALAQLAKPATTSAPPPTVPTQAEIVEAGVTTQRPILSSTAPLANPPSLVAGTNAPLTAPTGAFATATALTGGTPMEATRAGLAADSTTSNLAALQPGAADSQPALPQRLHQTLRESGMFYEAHLARWTRGTFSLTDLRNEPQARLDTNTHPMATAAGLTDMPMDAARLAGRQLLMLEGGPFLWQGFAWPGQWLEWQVQEQPGGGQGGGGAEPDTWATELRLTLPRLGGVTARLSLAGERLTVGLSAGDAGARDTLRDALPSLEHALQAAGLQPAGLSVNAAVVQSDATTP
jgi:flagellar hook-length control protein FliK